MWYLIALGINEQHHLTTYLVTWHLVTWQNTWSPDNIPGWPPDNIGHLTTYLVTWQYILIPDKYTSLPDNIPAHLTVYLVTWQHTLHISPMMTCLNLTIILILWEHIITSYDNILYLNPTEWHVLIPLHTLVIIW